MIQFSFSLWKINLSEGKGKTRNLKQYQNFDDYTLNSQT